MKLAPDIFSQQTLRACNCGKSSEKMRVNLRLVKRSLWMVPIASVVGVPVIIGLGAEKGLGIGLVDPMGICRDTHCFDLDYCA
jgi:hypothetical protein